MPLTITAHNQTVAFGNGVFVTSIFSVSGSALAYQIWFSYPEGGYPALGQVLGPFDFPISQDQSVWLSSLSGLTYSDSSEASGTDKIWLKAYDGTTWTNWVEADITDPGNSAPVVTGTSQTVLPGQRVPLNNIFSISGGAATISEYQIWFSDPEAGSPALGSLTQQSGMQPTILIPQDQSVWLPGQTGVASTLSTLSYSAGFASGTDKIWLKAYNGIWSNWVEADLTDLGSAPVITASNQTVLANQSIPLTSLFTVTGNEISQYQIWFGYPEGGSPALGAVTLGGAPIPQDQVVSTTSLSGLTFTGASARGTDKIWLKAYNGTWSSWVEADITDAVALPPVAAATDQTVGPQAALPPPTVTANNQTVAGGQSAIPITNIFSVSGTGVSAYQIWFGYPEGGSPALGQVLLNDLPIAQDQAVWLTTLTSFTYSPLSYLTGSAPGTDKIWLKAYNGIWSNWVEADLTDQGEPPPVITATNQVASDGTGIALTNMFSVSGVSGYPDVSYQIWFSDPEEGAPALGAVTVPNIQIAPDQAVSVTDLTNVTYIGGAAAGTDKIWLRAYNGVWSNWVEANITDLGISPPTITATNQSTLAGQAVALTNVFSVTGNQVSQYQIWFGYPEGGSPALGTVNLNGAPIPQDQTVSVTSLSNLTYLAPAAAGTDKIWLKAYDGVWSSWVEADLTEVGAAPPPPADPPNISLLTQYAASAFPSASAGFSTTASDWTNVNSVPSLASAHQ